MILECTVEPAVRTVYGLPYRWGLREASAAYVLGDTSTYKEKKFSAEVVHKHNLWTEKYSYVGGTSPSIGYHYY